MGVDTVKLSYKGSGFRYPVSRHLDPSMGWGFTGKHGSQGPVRWAEYRHEDGTVVRTKGVDREPTVLWEGSVGKETGVVGAADAGLVRLVDAHVRRLLGPPGSVPAPAVRRLDVTEDIQDPDGAYLAAAVDWNPHARSRYVQACYESRSDGGRTVFQHNKTRGVRVYEKYPESGFQEWARDLTRVEYQIRGEWLEKYGVDRLYDDFEEMAEACLRPVVADLRERVSRSGWSPERLLRPEGRV